MKPSKEKIVEYLKNKYPVYLRWRQITKWARIDLTGADLTYANLTGADLTDANLKYADLTYANLTGADLTYANLTDANLKYANLTDIRYNECTSFLALQCPEEGAFVGWKKCKNNVIVKLLIPEHAKRSSATSRKCRCSEAVVLDVYGAEYGVSEYDSRFHYHKGETVKVENFDENRWVECSLGIHFFITRREAELYN